jgi:predicted  nucleic acid-binding Zn-ribbon protein
MLKLSIYLSCILVISCTTRLKEEIKDIKYSAYEMIGQEKRDLFKKEVKTVRDGQEETQQAFEDALKKIQYFYSYDGGKTESEYNRLKNAYDQSQAEAKSLKSSIKELNEVASDLFDEWKDEIKDISSRDLRQQSSLKMTETREKYIILYGKLKESEKKMSPLLVKMNDQVLFLKHNLNAGAIGGLATEGERIEKDITQLIEEMKASNKEASEFIETL